MRGGGGGGCVYRGIITCLSRLPSLLSTGVVVSLLQTEDSDTGVRGEGSGLSVGVWQGIQLPVSQDYPVCYLTEVVTSPLQKKVKQGPGVRGQRSCDLALT